MRRANRRGSQERAFALERSVSKTLLHHTCAGNRHLKDGKNTKIAIVGAGAVGCYFGALLVRAGHDVTFLGRKPHVDAINARGLLLEMRSQEIHLRARAITDVAALETPQLVLFCVKSADTELTGTALASKLDSATVVLSLQNGVDNPQRLRAIIGNLVIPTVVYVGAEMAGPGHVKHHGRGELIIGSSPRSEMLAHTLEAAGIPTTVADDIEKVQWMKLVTNCAYNALSAVANIPYGPMTEVEGTNEFVAMRRGRTGMRCHSAGRHGPADSENSGCDAHAIFLDGTGSRPRQTDRDRFPERLRGSERNRTRPSDTKQFCTADHGQVGGTRQGYFTRNESLTPHTSRVRRHDLFAVAP